MTAMLAIIGQLQMDYDPGEPLLGQGHFGRVIKARDLQLDGQLAVKVIPKSSFPTGHSRYFEEAARIHAARHPNVIRVLYGCEDANDVYIAMPMYSKGSVAKLICQQNLTVREVIRLGLGMLNGLHHIHTVGLIHGDIKPSNVLIDDTGQAVLADFGLANHILPSSGTAPLPIAYNYHRPPEHFVSTHATARFDVYQAGLTLYRMIYGNDAVASAWTSAGPNALNHLAAGTLLPWPHQPIITRSLRDALKRALHPDPNSRTKSALDLANDIAKESRLLDWRPEPTTGGMKYRNESGHRQGEVTVHTETGGTFAVESTKKRGAGRARVRDYCRTGLTEHAAVSLARSAMEALERQ